MRPAASFLLAAALVAGLATPACSRDDRIQVAPADDAEMQQAEAQARETLPSFWNRIKSGDPQIDLAVIKLGFPTPNGATEYLWAAVRPQSETDHRAMLLNDAVEVSDLRAKQLVTFDPAQIGDWGYRKGGKFYGQFTTRVMIKRATPEIAQEQDASLWPKPLEGEAR
jgi:uncharacterized protein YegJ (DUF2314 family)